VGEKDMPPCRAYSPKGAVKRKSCEVKSVSENTLRPLRLKLSTLYVATIVSEKLSVEKSKFDIETVTADEPDNVP